MSDMEKRDGLSLVGDLFTILHQAATRLDAAGIRYALVGGLAYSLYVELRGTEDIDLLITPDDWDAVKATLAPMDFHEYATGMDFHNIRIRRLSRLGHDSLTVMDFLLADGDFIEGLDRRAAFEAAGGRVYLCPVDVLIRLKQGRMSAKDRSDIAGLEPLLGSPPPPAAPTP